MYTQGNTENAYSEEKYNAKTNRSEPTITGLWFAAGTSVVCPWTFIAGV